MKAQKKTLEETKAEQKFCFQLIKKETGKRSAPFVTNWSKLYESFKNADQTDENAPSQDDYILLVAVLDGEDTTIPTTPLITIRSYLAMMDNTPAEAEYTEE